MEVSREVVPVHRVSAVGEGARRRCLCIRARAGRHCSAPARSHGHGVGAVRRTTGRQREEGNWMKRILGLCTGNSARSQMGEGLFRHEGRGGYEVSSAGTKPSQVRPEAIAVMKELGIDISGHRSKSVDEFAGRPFDYVVTVCDNARDNCPVFPAGADRIHWSLEDPAAVQGSEQERLAAFRRIRDQLHERVKAFYRERASDERSGDGVPWGRNIQR